MVQVLLVDDHEEYRDRFGKILEEKGYQVILAHGGEQALELLKKEDFDLVITDLQMPIVNGVELLRNLRVMGKKTPIILMSTLIEEKEKKQYEKEGFCGVLSKVEFAEKIQELIKKTLKKKG